MNALAIFEPSSEQVEKEVAERQKLYWGATPGLLRISIRNNLLRENLVKAINEATTLDDIKKPLLAILQLTKLD
jgi:hypothetical protein